MPYTENETFPPFASVQNLYLLFVGTYNYNCYQFIIAKNPHGIRTFIFHCSYYFHFSGYIKHSKTGNIFICWWKLLLGENCGQSWETEVNDKIDYLLLLWLFFIIFRLVWWQHHQILYCLCRQCFWLSSFSRNHLQRSQARKSFTRFVSVSCFGSILSWFMLVETN